MLQRKLPNTLTQKRLKEVLHYDPLTGHFTWLKAYRTDRIGCRAGSTGRGWWQIQVDKERYAAHRLAFLYMTGDWPKQQVDHIDRNRGNNAWANLRDVSCTRNHSNRGMLKSNSSGVTGLTLIENGRFWRANVRMPNKVRKVTRHASREEAEASLALMLAEREAMFIAMEDLA